MAEGLLALSDLIGFAEKVEISYSGYPHVDPEVVTLAEQAKLLALEHDELRRQLQAITVEAQVGVPDYDDTERRFD